MKTLWEKGENAGNRHFLLFPQCFPKSSSQGLSPYPAEVWIKPNIKARLVIAYYNLE